MQRTHNIPVYTHHLPYPVRRAIWNLLDADQSWKTLGGQFMGLDTTELTLLGQAYLRMDGSPTEELFRRLDSANVRISQLCSFLEKMNHYRALETLKPYLIEQQHQENQIEKINHVAIDSTVNSIRISSYQNSGTLYTPTPSFADQPVAAILDYNYPIGAIENGLNSDWCSGAFNQQQPESMKDQARIQAPSNCHKLSATQNAQQQQPIKQPADGKDPMKVACTSERKRTSLSDQEVINQLRLIMQIGYNELKQASSDFSSNNILGNGGFASVYRGNWKGTDVAIKRLKFNLMEQALNEMSILNSYRIDNILPIYGISTDGPEACLVYQFMANGSLEDRLSCKGGTLPLTWSQRASIGEGVAKGLYYLHTLRAKPLIHGDVKSANVLLDSQFVPKLGDFGLARQMFKGQDAHTQLDTHCTVTSIHGTSVYLPPEYLRHKIFSPAVDVYSYGTVLLEMATGRRAYDGKRLLIDLVESALSKGFNVSTNINGFSIKDSRLSSESHDELRIWYDLLIKLGLNCADKVKKKRPDMGLVINKFSEFKQTIQAGNNSTLSRDANKNFLPDPFRSNATVCSPTPESNAFERQQPIVVAHQVNFDDRETFNRPTKYTKHELEANNWILMSVEEESDLSKQVKLMNSNEQEYQQNRQAPHEQVISDDGLSSGEKNDSALESPVEDMIPLLTELGIEAEQDQGEEGGEQKA